MCGVVRLAPLTAGGASRKFPRAACPLLTEKISVSVENTKELEMGMRRCVYEGCKGRKRNETIPG